MLEKLTREDFDSRIGDSFRLSLPSGEAMELRLLEAAEIGGTGKARSPFSVVFRGPNEPVLPQAIYHLEHDGMGPLEIFLVPLSQGSDGVDYEAVFT
jgi:hypothetical protein